MKKLLLFCLCLLVLSITQVHAQGRTIAGTVTGKDDGYPIPGASVQLKGAKTGTTTDGNGRYTIKVDGSATALVITSVGYARLELAIGASNTLNATLVSDNKQLSEVVVTGLGVNAAKKSLGYSQATIHNEAINASSPINPLGALQGKVAGVNISNLAGAAGGSTKVIMRGYTSISGTNQPLYIIDGVPLDNSRPGSDGNNFDVGNGANDINPDLIDNISFLKGSGATAIYGSRGSNGVIIITTKKGKTGKPAVTISTSTQLTNLGSIYKPQDEFGQGWDYRFIPGENGNWGPRFDDQLRPWGSVVNNQQLLKPFSSIKNNIKDSYDTGVDLNNNVTVSGGNDNSTYLMSYNNIYSNGILPGDVDVFKRNNFSLRGTTTYKNFSADASLNYVAKNGSFVATGQGPTGIGSTFYENILNVPNDIPIKDLRDYNNTFFNIDNYYTPYAVNPYWSLANNGNHVKSDRLYGNINLNYKFTDWFTLQLQQGADVTNSAEKIWYNSNSPTPGSWVGGGNTEGQSRGADVGSISEASYQIFQYDTKLNALFNKKFSDFDFTGFIGSEYNDRGTRTLATAIQGLAIPGFYNISNTVNKPSSAETEAHQRIVSFYAQGTLAYKNYLYLTLTGRNDITSTLSSSNNSYFYPSANLSYVLSQSLNMKSDAVSYIKLRASYGETGSDTNPYQVSNILSATNVGLGFGNLAFPFAGVPGFSISNTLLSANLKPERVKEYEFGGEIRFLNDRVGIDATVYQKTRTDQILPVPIAPSSGYTTEVINAGTARNRGVEIALNATPVKSKDVTWDVTYTFTHSRTTVLSLPDGSPQVTLNTDGYGGQFVALAGQPLGQLMAPVPAYDPQGHIIVNSQGFPVQSTANGLYGNFQHDFVMGFNSNVTVKNFTLGVTAEYDKGGVFYSGTEDLLSFVGADPHTLYNDRNPFIVPNSVQQVGNTYVENTTPITESNIDDYYYQNSNKAQVWQRAIMDRSFFKIREVTLKYSLPKKLVNGWGLQNASVSLFGRNLYTWLPAGNNSIDPEVSNYGSDLASEYGEFRTAPPLKYYGVTLKVSL
jgi:TonB-linked SusC/RagA family outer membrane protein